ncbi:hypothetical protein [uncultured Marinococcus sp.]|uniref:hypothetical protein n=1 Tax=uncultured Marinococcus sp. TaxID=487012 RepID=UPI002618804D|nr:hypothetical protein [uncultured Marinococcus sp.]
MDFLEVTHNDIEKLSDQQLTELLSILLYFEAEEWGIPASAVGVALNINASDGGEDGRIKWEEGVERTSWLPNRFTLFQCKATDMPPSKCKEEILINEQELKPMVRQVIEQEGAYILFHNHSLNEQQKQTRIDRFQEAIEEAEVEAKSESIAIYIYDANEIAAWTNKSLSAIVAVWHWVGKHLPNGAMTWKDWSGYQDNSYSYIFNELNESNIKQLRNHFTGVKKVARIIGLSGLGKTRLAFETFRPPNDPNDLDQLARSKQAIYLDAANNPTSLSNSISTWRAQRLKGTVIVDNCNPETHKALKEEIEHSDSQLNLLTLDFNPERYSSDHPYIELKPVSDEVIEGIISQSYPGIVSEDIERIIHFAQGFPKIAVLLAKARLNMEDDIGSLRDDALIHKLLWDRDGKDSIKLKVLSACALFDHIGFEDEASSHRQFVTEHICRVSNEEFYETCQYFIERGILDVRGRYIRVTPQPLAIRLAADWWKKCPPETAYQILTTDMPAGMSEALCDQMAKLHFLPKAQELTSSICGEQAPFGQAEVLNSEKGSRLFRSLVEVNPTATSRTLKRVFGSMSIKELLQIKAGRRNLVWALEKLCFWEDTFAEASRILLYFAAAENESWANNATAQFLQLFHYVLSGTQAPPNERIDVIDYALESNKYEVRLLGLEALGHALQTHHFSRMLGVEKQGSRPISQEWRPETWGEVFNYWQNVLDRLTQLAINDEEMSERALNLIANNIRGLVSHGRIEEIEKSLKIIIGKKGPFWPTALENIKDTIEFDSSKIPRDALERIENWVRWLQPKDFINQLKLIVSLPKWRHEKNDGGQYIDISSEEAKKFAAYTVKDQYKNFLDNLYLVLVGEQRKAYIFGYEIARLVEEPNFLLIEIKNQFDEIINQKIENINISFVGGVLSALQNENFELVENFLDEFSESPSLGKYTVELTRYINISENDIDRIIESLKNRKININTLNTLAYGSVLDHLESETILKLIAEIIKHESKEFTVSWHILYMYVYNDAEKFKMLSGKFKEMLLIPDLLINDKIHSYEISEIIKGIILNDDSGRGEFISSFSRKIMNLLSTKLNFDQLKNLREYTNILMKYGWEHSWPVFAEVLLCEDKIIVYNTINLLESKSLIYETTWPLEAVPQEILIEWCKVHIKAPEMLSTIVPVLEDDKNKITSIAYHLVFEYGDNERVLRNISSSLNTFSWSGSLIPYLQRQIEVYQTFKKHNSWVVKEWAQNNIERLYKNIENEKKQEEENDLGFY